MNIKIAIPLLVILALTFIAILIESFIPGESDTPEDSDVIVILGGGGFAIWMVVTERSFKTLFAKKNNSMDLDSIAMSGLGEAKTTNPAQKNGKKNDILELSLPDD